MIANPAHPADEKPLSLLRIPVPDGVSGVPILSTDDTNRDEWLEARKVGIGSSDAASALGLNPWQSPLALWLEKRGEVPGFEGNERTYWGLALEEPVARRFAEETGLTVRQADVLLVHPEHDWMRATPDRWFYDPETGEHGILELKCTDGRHAEDWEGEAVPDHYYIQVQWQLAVTGLRRAWIAVLIGGNLFVCVEILRDEAMIADLIAAGLRFWQSVMDGTEPPADGSSSTTDVLRERYRYAEEGSSVELGDELEWLIARRAIAREAVKEAEAEADQIDNRIRQLVGHAELATANGIPRFSWKSSVRRNFDSTRHKAEHPDCHDQFMKETSVRTLRALKTREEG